MKINDCFVKRLKEQKKDLTKCHLLLYDEICLLDNYETKIIKGQKYHTNVDWL